jgi:hypothetical protein
MNTYLHVEKFLSQRLIATAKERVDKELMGQQICQVHKTFDRMLEELYLL